MRCNLRLLESRYIRLNEGFGEAMGSIKQKLKNLISYCKNKIIEFKNNHPYIFIILQVALVLIVSMLIGYVVMKVSYSVFNKIDNSAKSYISNDGINPAKRVTGSEMKSLIIKDVERLHAQADKLSNNIKLAKTEKAKKLIFEELSKIEKAAVGQSKRFYKIVSEQRYHNQSSKDASKMLGLLGTFAAAFIITTSDLLVSNTDSNVDIDTNSAKNDAEYQKIVDNPKIAEEAKKIGQEVGIKPIFNIREYVDNIVDRFSTKEAAAPAQESVPVQASEPKAVTEAYRRFVPSFR